MQKDKIKIITIGQLPWTVEGMFQMVSVCGRFFRSDANSIGESVIEEITEEEYNKLKKYEIK